MSQHVVNGRTFLINQFKGEHHFTVSELCTTPMAGCKAKRHYHMVSQVRNYDEGVALLEAAYGNKEIAP